jgi:hypothetical protein
MALIFGIPLFPIRVIRVIRGSSAFGILAIEVSFGFGNWNLELPDEMK